MKEAGGGSIINLGSVSWHTAICDLSLYETAKAGIEGMTRALARDLGEATFASTAWCRRHPHAAPDEVMAHARGRGQDPRAAMPEARVDPVHVTAMVLFLASADAAMCTAHNYWVDGGYC